VCPLAGVARAHGAVVVVVVRRPRPSAGSDGGPLGPGEPVVVPGEVAVGDVAVGDVTVGEVAVGEVVVGDVDVELVVELVVRVDVRVRVVDVRVRVVDVELVGATTTALDVGTLGVVDGPGTFWAPEPPPRPPDTQTSSSTMPAATATTAAMSAGPDSERSRDRPVGVTETPPGAVRVRNGSSGPPP